MTEDEVKRMLYLAKVAEDLLASLPPWQRALKANLVRQGTELIALVQKAGIELRGKVSTPRDV